MDDIVYGIAALLPLLAGFSVAKRYGLWRGIAAGVVFFAAAVLVLVTFGYGY